MEQPRKLLNKNFLLQWQGQTVSRIGSQLFAAAMVFWIKRATGSASIVGLISLLAGIPGIVLTPIGGALADRFSRRKIMIVSDLLRGLALLALTLLLFLRPSATGAILASIFAFAILNAAVNAFFGPAISATIPDLVPPNRVNAANSLGQLSMQISMFLGQGLGGLLFRLVGAPVLFLVNALSFLYSAFSEAFVQIPQTYPERKGDAKELFRAFGRDIIEGLRYVQGRPGLRELVIMSALLGFFLAPVVVLLPFYIEDWLGLRPDWYGFLLVAFGVGTLLGYVLAGVANFAPRTRGRVVIALTFVNAAAYALLGVVRSPFQAVALAVLGGLGSGFVTLNVTTLVQVTTPSEIRGRVLGLLSTLSAALAPIAMGISGIVADLLNQNIGLVYAACGVLALLLALVMAGRRPYREILMTDYASGDAAAAPGKRANLQENERSRDVYEHIATYVEPPLPPLPIGATLDEVLAENGQPKGSSARKVTDLAFALAGVHPFLDRLPDNIERLLRSHNMRLPGLYAPVIAATLALKEDERITDPYLRAASLILGARGLQRDVFSGELPPDTLKGEPLEMGQYPGLFSTTQVVERGFTRMFKSNEFSRINVIVGNVFHIVELGAPGSEPSVQVLAATLREISTAALGDSRDPHDSPGILTCSTGPTQFQAFPQLQQIEENRAALEALKHTMFTVCLDLADNPTSLAEAARISQSRNAGNRWFHASLQLVVFANAMATAICNFTAYLDGNVMMRGGAEIQRRAARQPLSGAEGPTIPFRKLAWRIPATLLIAAERDLRMVQDDQEATFELPGFGRDFFNQRGVVPVPGFIAALQATGNHLAGKPANIVQFYSMSRYRCTDLISGSASTPELHRFSDLLLSAGADPGEGRTLLQSAIATQTERARSYRKTLSLPIILNLLVRSRRGIASLWTSAILRLRAMLLMRFGVEQFARRDILISHPDIYEEIPIVGRPGVRLPYVTYFGLHYQIMADKTVITMMPGMKWQVPNERVIEVLCDNLSKLKMILDETTTA